MYRLLLIGGQRYFLHLNKLKRLPMAGYSGGNWVAMQRYLSSSSMMEMFAVLPFFRQHLLLFLANVSSSFCSWRFKSFRNRNFFLFWCPIMSTIASLSSLAAFSTINRSRSGLSTVTVCNRTTGGRGKRYPFQLVHCHCESQDKVDTVRQVSCVKLSYSLSCSPEW